ncbi:hypothetical protein ACFYUY_24420 [Kitasatospora sp. NPDC004745]|uniref:hypothetical protein n=1 Tax=Kitasatospora sp. NPDC004745 TaxID=3364019 RepID=UPI0036A6B903
MTGAFDIHTRLPAALTDRAQTGRFIADFAASWHQPLWPGDGWSAEQLAACEHRLGLALPAALRETYLLLGRRSDLTANHDTLLRPDELHVLAPAP